MAGALAQLVEQWTENPCVPGSIPGGTTVKRGCQWQPLFYFSIPNFNNSFYDLCVVI